MVRARARDLERFQSMLPVGGATITIVCPCLLITVSIHALREESDQPREGRERPCVDFNPRSPWGERRGRGHDHLCRAAFQSTLSVGRATIDGYLSDIVV